MVAQKNEQIYTGSLLSRVSGTYRQLNGITHTVRDEVWAQAVASVLQEGVGE